MCLSTFKKLLEVLSAFRLNRGLPEKLIARGKLPEELVVQIVAICDDYEGRGFQPFLKLFGVEDHGERLSTPLSMPEHSSSTICLRSPDRCLHGLFHCVVLMVGG